MALFSLHGLSSLIILSLLELILGVDNIIFISLLLTKLPEGKRFTARVTALSLAFVMRLVMLFALVWLSNITTTLFTVSGFQASLRDILFFIGGAYLAYNTIKELAAVHHPIAKSANYQISFSSAILQVVMIDILFSFDSIFTAIGLIQNLFIMSLAIGFGMLFMVFLSGKTTSFMEKNPTVKTIALWFIIAVGLSLIVQALHFDIPKEYMYAAFGIAFAIELLNLLRKKRIKT